MTLRVPGGGGLYHPPRQSAIRVIETDSRKSPFLTGEEQVGMWGVATVSGGWVAGKRIALSTGSGRRAARGGV